MKLRDGKEFEGIAFGADTSSALGELVFNTGIPGYQEILTDPSYAGQIVLLTSPMIGNYGAADTDNESDGIKASALVVRKLYRGPVMQDRITLDDFMKKHNVRGIEGVDTRAITLHLREHGSQNAVIFYPEEREEAEKLLSSFPEITERDLLDGVSVKKAIYNPDLGTGFTKAPEKPLKHIAIVDYGIKRSIIDNFYKVGAAVTLFPHTVKAEEILAANPDALFLSNGPGDPALQIITIAIGGKTEKMKFGHHGSNHPVRDTLTGKTFVTAQNHGFMSSKDSLPKTTSIWFTNANDGTVEGLYDETLNVRSVQFHPEAAPGPEDALWIFRTFMEKAR